MAKYRVDAVAMMNGEGPGIVAAASDIDVVAAAAKCRATTALEVAATKRLAVWAGESVQHAAELMSEQMCRTRRAGPSERSSVRHPVDVRRRRVYANMKGDPHEPGHDDPQP